MKRTITYSLHSGAANSDQFYSDIASFTTSWLSRTLPTLESLIVSLNACLKDRAGNIRSVPSVALDLLALGVLLREHTDDFQNFPAWATFLLRKLGALQERYPGAESWIKFLRGILHYLAHFRLGKRIPSRFQLDGLIDWLDAQGDKTPAKRFAEIVNCVRSLDMEEQLVAQCLALADDFIPASMIALGKYTSQVDNFLAQQNKKARCRYDSRLISSTRAEYHLGMLGTEILNREFRSLFQATPRKVVILPPCMRARSETECRATTTRYGERCMACTPTCRIHQVTCLGEKHGFDVFMIPEEIRVYQDDGNTGEKTGVVGVSCVLTNWIGGWDAERIGLPAQGVMLDFVGCKYHWDKDGFPTDLNFHQLLRILALDEK